MSEIADELERMSREFWAKREEHAALEARYRDDPGAVDSETLHAASADAWRSAAALLVERAAELRAQRSGPTYKAQSKPTVIMSHQWWMRRGGAPCRPYGFSRFEGDAHVYFAEDDGTKTAERVDAVLSSPDWTYLGDGPEPAR